MNKTTLFALGAALLVILATALFIFKTPAADNGSASNAEDTEIRALVTGFGTKMQMVSLLASTAERQAAMQEHYSAYVAPELLAEWYPEGAEGALGRYSSSPWPERIEIVSVVPRASGKAFESYQVEGNVIEVTNEQAGAGKEAAAVYPVSLTVEKRGGGWLITRSIKGAYSALPQRQTVVGFWECLPHKDTSGPQTMECAFGIAIDQSDGHYAVNTSLMSTYPVDFPTGTKVRVSGVVTPATHLSSVQKYDIDGIIMATTIEKVE